jgi:hypothetical protein
MVGKSAAATAGGAGGGGGGSGSPGSPPESPSGAMCECAYRITGLLDDGGGTVEEVIPPTPLAQPEAILMTAGRHSWGVEGNGGGVHNGADVTAAADDDDAQTGQNWRQENENEMKRSQLVLEALARYIPAAAQESVVSSGSVGHARSHQWLGEIRLCSVVFVNFTGIDYTGTDAVKHVQKAMIIMQSFILQYGGSLRQFLVEDKGSTLIAAFGLPASTYEDDAWRAAGLALFTALFCSQNTNFWQPVYVVHVNQSANLPI